MALLLWIQAHFLSPRELMRLDTPKGSEAGTPCLLSRLYDIDCPRLAAANVSYLQQLVARTDWKDSKKCMQKPLEQLAENCEDLKKHHGYHRWPVTPQEEDFPLAFGIKIHKAPDMFERLLRVLWRPQNLYCIHVDSKTPPDVFQVVKNLSNCFPNVVLTEVRVDLIYLSVGSLLSDMQCMRVALKSTIPWKYYLNLSGQEFPLKTNLEMVQILALLNGKNDVESYLPGKYVSGWFSFKHVILNGSIYRTKERKAPFMYPIRIRKGSAYGAFSRKFMDFALNNNMAVAFLHWLADTQAPDELFWATLNHLPGVPGGVEHPVSHRYGTVLSRAVVWQWDQYKCKTYVRAVCIYTASDLPWLISRHELIANKFDETTDPIVLDCLEDALERRTFSAYRDLVSSPFKATQTVASLNWTFYKNLPHLK
ncbi:beta-1,3-galactosyl-O-glycosyl-glycoprotein beta-1,6-N-acetylglucosaminyltransferase 3-like [Littorina saxatilis]